MFTRDFDRYTCEGDTITCEVDGFTLTATVYRDDQGDSPEERDEGFWPSLDPKSAGYIGPKSKSTLARHMARAKAIMEAWKNDEWFYCGVAVTASREGVELTQRYGHALWGIECNYPVKNISRENPNTYLREVANEYAAETLDDAKAIVTKLAT